MNPECHPLSPGAGYVRSATNDRSSLEEQIRQIKDKAAKDGVEIAKIYSDPQQSGINTSRPGLAHLLQDTDQGLFHFVYVQSVERLARRSDLFVEILQGLLARNATLRVIEQDYDSGTPKSELTLSLLDSFQPL